MAEKQNLLDILTRADRPTFTIDGKSYEMRHPNELSMTEFHQLGVEGAKLTELAQAYSTGEFTDAAKDKIIASMDALIDLVAPDLPPKVREKLNPFHVQQIVQAFTGLVRSDGKPGEQQSRKKSSRASRASIPARRRRTG